MAREIKFRAWDNNKNTWVQNHLILDVFDVVPKDGSITLMQYGKKSSATSMKTRSY